MNRYRVKKRVFSFLKAFMLLLLVVIIAFPFWQLIVSSMLDTNAIISYPPKFWPSGGSLSNYTEVLKMQGGAYLRWTPFWQSRTGSPPLLSGAPPSSSPSPPPENGAGLSSRERGLI